jgi:hypothetical protein
MERKTRGSTIFFYSKEYLQNDTYIYRKRLLINRPNTDADDDGRSAEFE